MYFKIKMVLVFGIENSFFLFPSLSKLETKNTLKKNHSRGFISIFLSKPLGF